MSIKLIAIILALIATVSWAQSDECPVCLDTLRSARTVKPPCNHAVCTTCYNKIFETQAAPSCPLCRESYTAPSAPSAPMAQRPRARTPTAPRAPTAPTAPRAPTAPTAPRAPTAQDEERERAEWIRFFVRLVFAFIEALIRVMRNPQ